MTMLLSIAVALFAGLLMSRVVNLLLRLRKKRCNFFHALQDASFLF